MTIHDKIFLKVINIFVALPRYFSVPQGCTNYNFFVHEISCTQNRFRCASVRVGNWVRKRADMQVINNGIIRPEK